MGLWTDRAGLECVVEELERAGDLDHISKHSPKWRAELGLVFLQCALHFL